MNFVVAVLLLVVDEETAFWRLATLQAPCNPAHPRAPHAPQPAALRALRAQTAALHASPGASRLWWSAYCPVTSRVTWP